MTRTEEQAEHHHPHHVHVEAKARGRHRRLRNAFDALTLLLTVVAAIYLWPASMGGATHFIVVEGHSMEPTFHFGDVVIARDNPHPHIGQIIAYHVPKDSPAAGKMIIHRVKAIWPDGTYQTQGDNRTTPDQFHITSADIIGTPVRAIPHLGRLIGLSTMPWVVAIAAGGLTVFLLLPTSGDDEDGDDAGDGANTKKAARKETDSGTAGSAVDAILARLQEERLREATAARASALQAEREAQAWLDAELAAHGIDA